MIGQLNRSDVVFVLIKSDTKINMTILDKRNTYAVDYRVFEKKYRRLVYEDFIKNTKVKLMENTREFNFNKTSTLIYWRVRL